MKRRFKQEGIYDYTAYKTVREPCDAFVWNTIDMNNIDAKWWRLTRFSRKPKKKKLFIFVDYVVCQYKSYVIGRGYDKNEVFTAN